MSVITEGMNQIILLSQHTYCNVKDLWCLCYSFVGSLCADRLGGFPAVITMCTLLTQWHTSTTLCCHFIMYRSECTNRQTQKQHSVFVQKNAFSSASFPPVTSKATAALPPTRRNTITSSSSAASYNCCHNSNCKQGQARLRAWPTTSATRNRATNLMVLTFLLRETNTAFIFSYFVTFPQEY